MTIFKPNLVVGYTARKCQCIAHCVDALDLALLLQSQQCFLVLRPRTKDFKCSEQKVSDTDWRNNWQLWQPAVFKPTTLQAMYGMLLPGIKA